MLGKVLKTTNKLVSLYVFAVAILLVIYMLVNFIGWLGNFAQLLFSLLSWEAEISNWLTTASRWEVGTEVLHFIAFTIVLVKAYNILIEYAKHQHISIKYIVEIAIIASVVEIFFNTYALDIETKVLFAVFWLWNLALYLIYYPIIEKLDRKS